MQQQQSKSIEEEEEFTGPTLIGKLEEFGISAADVKKLMEAGFQTVESITFTAKKNLVTIKGITENKIDKILEVGMTLMFFFIPKFGFYCIRWDLFVFIANFYLGFFSVLVVYSSFHVLCLLFNSFLVCLTYIQIPIFAFSKQDRSNELPNRCWFFPCTAKHHPSQHRFLWAW